MNSQTINFFTKLKDKKSSELLNELFDFVNNKYPQISLQINDPGQISAVVQDYVSKSVNEFAKVWNIEFTNNKYAYIEISDGFEALITKSLYQNLMSVVGEDNRVNDLIRKYAFINGKNLGIEQTIDEFELSTHLKSNRLINFRFL